MENMSESNTWGSLLVEFSLTRGKATRRRVVSLLFSLIFFGIAAAAFFLWYESFVEMLLVIAFVAALPGFLLLFRGIRSKPNSTQIFENGVIHTRGRKTREFDFRNIIDVSLSSDGNVMWVQFGLIGGLLTTFMGKSLLTFSYNGTQDMTIKRIHAYKFKLLSAEVIKAYTGFVTGYATFENIGNIVLTITDNIKLEAGQFIRTRALRRNIEVPLADIKRVSTNKGTVRLMGISDTGGEAELLKINVANLSNEAIFWHIIKIINLKEML